MSGGIGLPMVVKIFAFQTPVHGCQIELKICRNQNQRWIVGKLKLYRVSQAQSHKFILLGSNPAFDVGFVKLIDNFRVFRENIGTCWLADLLEKI
jgi:hypothetical protein